MNTNPHLASILVRDLASILDLARELRSDLDRSRARTRAYPVDRVHPLDSAHAIARRLEAYVVSICDRSRAYDRALTRALDRAHASALTADIARELDRDRDRAFNDYPGHTRDRARARSGAHDRASDLDRVLVTALGHARILALDIGRGRPGDTRRQRGVGRVAPSVSRLLAVATRLLPASYRVGYAEEFWAELWEITHAGGRRRAQLAYAVRVVMSARRLRTELQVPRRRGVAP